MNPKMPWLVLMLGIIAGICASAASVVRAETSLDGPLWIQEQETPAWIVAGDRRLLRVSAGTSDREDGRVDPKVLDLHRAIQSGNRKEVKRLLKDGVDPNAVTAAGTPPIWRAAIRNESRIAKLLVKSGADLDAANANGTTALYVAAQQGNAKIAQQLISAGADVNLRSIWGSSPLLVAAYQGHASIVSALLEAGANAELLTAKREESPMFMAATYGRQDVVRLLAESDKLLMDVPNRDGVTPLYAAVANGHIGTVQAILKYGPDLNHQKQDGSVALHAAAGKCYAKIVSALLDAGAQRDVRNGEGYRPIDIVCMNQPNAGVKTAEIEDMLMPLLNAVRKGDSALVATLIAQGEDANAFTKDNKTLLHVAIGTRNQQVVGVLLRGRADPRLQDADGTSPLHVAAATGVPSIAAMLLAAGADANAQNAQNETALHIASQAGDVAMVEAITPFQPDPNIQDEDGNTALHVATSLGNIPVVAALLELKADPTVQNDRAETPKDIAASRGFDDISALFSADDEDDMGTVQLSAAMPIEEKPGGNQEKETTTDTSGSSTILWIIPVVLALVIVVPPALISIYVRCRPKQKPQKPSNLRDYLHDINKHDYSDRQSDSSRRWDSSPSVDIHQTDVIYGRGAQNGTSPEFRSQPSAFGATDGGHEYQGEGARWTSNSNVQDDGYCRWGSAPATVSRRCEENEHMSKTRSQPSSFETAVSGSEFSKLPLTMSDNSKNSVDVDTDEGFVSCRSDVASPPPEERRGVSRLALATLQRLSLQMMSSRSDDCEANRSIDTSGVFTSMQAKKEFDGHDATVQKDRTSCVQRSQWELSGRFTGRSSGEQAGQESESSTDGSFQRSGVSQCAQSGGVSLSVASWLQSEPSDNVSPFGSTGGAPGDAYSHKATKKRTLYTDGCEDGQPHQMAGGTQTPVFYGGVRWSAFASSQNADPRTVQEGQDISWGRQGRKHPGCGEAHVDQESRGSPSPLPISCSAKGGGPLLESLEEDQSEGHGVSRADLLKGWEGDRQTRSQANPLHFHSKQDYNSESSYSSCGGSPKAGSGANGTSFQHGELSDSHGEDTITSSASDSPTSEDYRDAWGSGQGFKCTKPGCLCQVLADKSNGGKQLERWSNRQELWASEDSSKGLNSKRKQLALPNRKPPGHKSIGNQLIRCSVGSCASSQSGQRTPGPVASRILVSMGGAAKYTDSSPGSRSRQSNHSVSGPEHNGGMPLPVDAPKCPIRVKSSTGRHRRSHSMLSLDISQISGQSPANMGERAWDSESQHSPFWDYTSIANSEHQQYLHWSEIPISGPVQYSLHDSESTSTWLPALGAATNSAYSPSSRTAVTENGDPPPESQDGDNEMRGVGQKHLNVSIDVCEEPEETPRAPHSERADTPIPHSETGQKEDVESGSRPKPLFTPSAQELTAYSSGAYSETTTLLQSSGSLLTSADIPSADQLLKSERQSSQELSGNAATFSITHGIRSSEAGLPSESGQESAKASHQPLFLTAFLGSSSDSSKGSQSPRGIVQEGLCA